MANKKKGNIRFFTVHPSGESAQFNLSIFNILKKESPASISSMGRRAGTPDDIAAGYIDSCLKRGLLKISGVGEERLVEFNSNYGKLLGVGFDSGGYILTVMDLSGNVVTREHGRGRPLSELKGRNKEIKEIIEMLRDSTGLGGTEFCLAGVAVPDRLNEMNPKFANGLAEGISRLFDCDVLIAKEATAAGYGERDFGEQASGTEVLYMHSDVGMGVVIKNEMIFEADRNTENEDTAYLRPWAQFSIVSTAKCLVNKGVGTEIVDMVNGDVESITLETVLEAAQRHDELAEDLVKRSGFALGVRVSYLVNMFNTEIVILGGGVEQKGAAFVQFVRESAERFLLKSLADKVRIISGILGKEACSVGAASLCRRELFMEV